VVVVHDGKVIAERYAAGIGVDTPLMGFSMTKSVVNALIGVMTQQGLTSPSLPAPVPEWRGANDPRREIEVENLLRMTTGLALDETNSGFDPSSQMIYLHDDMAALPRRRCRSRRGASDGITAAPRRNCWRARSATPSADPEQTLAFAWRELFNPLGMRNVTLEFDGSGTLQGIDLHAGERAGLGAVWIAVSERRHRRRKTRPARGLGGFFGRGDARHRLWRRLLDQSQRASQRQGPRPARYPRDAFFASAISASAS
jgi:Beta-lactamase class C and other penicillin binding proteins